MLPGTAQDAGTIPIHVQVIDIKSKALDMVVPTYLTVEDLTTRVARDAGLGAFWEDGSRRRFYLRARGRILEDKEKLKDLHLVPHELLHLLPEPPAGSGLVERRPAYPPNRGYAGAGNGTVVASLLGVVVWVCAWTAALIAEPAVWVAVFPGMGLSVLVTSLARHTWGGEGNALRIPISALVMWGLLICGVGALTLALGSGSAGQVSLTLLLAGVAGMFGVLLSWLAWFGAVEGLPELAPEDTGEPVVMESTCAICGGAVESDVFAPCKFGCGKSFHAGCLSAREALHQGNSCAVCGYQPA